MNMRRLSACSAVVALAALLASLLPASAQSDVTERVSVDSHGTEGNGMSTLPSISADGPYVVFDSAATNLVAGDTNGKDDVFVHDRTLHVTTRVSVGPGGAQSDGQSQAPAISADGRWVAFESSATNLVAGDSNGWGDVFVHDRATGATTRVSVGSGGDQANGQSKDPAISADGRYVAFQSAATNLAAGDTNLVLDVFVHDRDTGETTIVSTGLGSLPGDGHSQAPSISADGLHVAFESAATNLLPGDGNGTWDIFVYSFGGKTTRASVGPGSVEANGASWRPAISADGRYVAFESAATNLVAGDTNGENDVFVHDGQTGLTVRASTGAYGAEANALSQSPAISADGRWLAFASRASNLVPGDTNGAMDVFLCDLRPPRGLTTHQVIRVSVDSAGAEGNGHSYAPAVSADGCCVAFYSEADNLVSGDANAVQDVFVRAPATPARLLLPLVLRGH